MTLRTSSPAGAYQKISVGASAVSLSNVPGQATYAVIVPETQAIRYRDDGVDPTATDGMPVAAGATLTYTGDPAKFRMIAQTSTATVHVSYYAARNPS